MATRKSILVYGWYGHSNIGDDMFKPALQKLLPKESLVFADRINVDCVKAGYYRGLIFGGGSFMDQPIKCINGTIDEVVDAKLPTAYIGVGCGENIHADHRKMLKASKGAFFRDFASKHHACFGNHVGDLVFFCDDIHRSHPSLSNFEREEKTLLVMPSDHFTPRQSSPIWMYQAHEWFVREMGKALDRFIEDGWNVRFVSMCNNNVETDVRPFYAITGKMNRHPFWAPPRNDFGAFGILTAVARATVVVTQRFHGGVFASASGTPCVLIDGHDKMKTFSFAAGQARVPYYGFTDAELIRTVDFVKSQKTSTIYAEGVRKSWQDTQPLVEEIFA